MKWTASYAWMDFSIWMAVENWLPNSNKILLENNGGYEFEWDYRIVVNDKAP